MKILCAKIVVPSFLSIGLLTLFLCLSTDTDASEKTQQSILNFSNDFIYAPDSIRNYLASITSLTAGQQDSVLVRLGIVYSQRGSYDSALNFYFKGLDLVVSNGLISKEARYLTTIGLCYMSLAQFEKSETYHQRSLKIYQDLDDRLNVSRVYNNMALLYLESTEYERALYYSKEVVVLRKELELNEWTYNYPNLARAYFHLDMYDSAMKYYSIGLQHLRQNGDTFSESIVHGYLGELLSAIGQYNRSVEEYTRGIKMADSIGAKTHVRDMLKGISDVYFKSGRTEEAFEALSQERLLSDSLERRRNNEEIAKQEYYYQDKILEYKKSAEIYRRDLVIFIISAVTLILFFLVYWYVQKLKSAKKLQQYIEAANRQKVVQLQQKEELNSIRSFLEGQEKERIRVARDLHDGVGGMLASLKLNVQGIVEKASLSGFESMVLNIDTAYQEVRYIAENLAPPNFEMSNFTDAINSYFVSINPSNILEINTHFDPKEGINQLPESIKVTLYRITQELITNALKHSEAKTIDFQLLTYDDWINLIVEDDGVGFEPLKDVNGMGLTNIKSRVSALGGKVDIDSVEGRGSIFNIDIPMP